MFLVGMKAPGLFIMTRYWLLLLKTFPQRWVGCARPEKQLWEKWKKFKILSSESWFLLLMLVAKGGCSVITEDLILYKYLHEFLYDFEFLLTSVLLMEKNIFCNSEKLYGHNLLFLWYE